MSKSSLVSHSFSVIGLPVLVVLMLLQIWQLHGVRAVKANLSRPAITKVLPAPVITQTPAPVAAPAPAPAPVAAPKTTTTATTTKKATTAVTQPATDIASTSTCPNQDVVAQTSTVLQCMTTYARKFHGLGAIATNSILTSAAVAKANDINGTGPGCTAFEFSHTACGHTSNYWIDQYNYPGNCSGENIALGQKTPGKVFVAWMNSTGHRENILRASYTQLGVAPQQSASNGLIWVMELGGC